MYIPKFSKSSYKSLGPSMEKSVCRILAESNKYRVATYEISRSQGCMVPKDIFLDGMYNRFNIYRIVPWLHGSYIK